MFKVVYIVQSLDTGEFLSVLDGQAIFSLDMTKAYAFQSVNEAINHARVFNYDLEHVSIVSLFMPVS